MNKHCPTCGAPVEQIGEDLYYIPVFPDVDELIYDSDLDPYGMNATDGYVRPNIDEDVPNTYGGGS